MKSIDPNAPVAFSKMSRHEKKQVINYVAVTYARIMIDIMLKYSALTLNDEFGFGAVRIGRFVRSARKMLNKHANDFTDSDTGASYISEVLDKQLLGRGLTVEFGAYDEE